MLTCFLFAQTLTEESCLSLRLDDQGKLDAPLETRTLDAVRELQVNCRTMVVLPTDTSSLHSLELPWLSDRKARAAIPYALEEHIAQSVSSVHVAFDQQYYQNNTYLVVVIDKAFLQNLILRLDEASIAFDAITLDWFALHVDEACVQDNRLLVNDVAFKGVLSGVLADNYLANRSGSNLVTMSLGSFYEWVAKRLLNTHVLNLCQGELQHQTRDFSNKRWYQLSGALAGLWLVSYLIIHAVISHQLTNKMADLDQKIAVIYREFFPQAHQVISPRFRVEQLLKQGRGGQDHALWPLQDRLAEAMHPDELTINQFHYQNQTLSIILLANDFAALEGLQQRLQQAGVNVTQAQAASHEKHVLATLELRL